MSQLRTGLSCPYGDVQRGDKIRKDGIHLIQSCQDIYDIRTRIGVLLRKNRGQERCDCLFSSASRRVASKGHRFLHQEHAHLLEHFLL